MVTEATLRTQDCCYLSTPAHVRSFIGRFVYIYTDKGELRLTADRLRFRGKTGIPLDIALHSIVNIGSGHYSRWAKPARLDYIAVTYQDGADEPTVLLTPTRSWATPTWETNKIVAEWAALIQEARPKSA